MIRPALLPGGGKLVKRQNGTPTRLTQHMTWAGQTGKPLALVAHTGERATAIRRAARFAQVIAGAAFANRITKRAEKDTMWLDYRKVDWLELLSEEPPVEDRPA